MRRSSIITSHDHDQYAGTNGLPDYGTIPENRQRVYFGWQATPATNLNLKALVNYQSDALLEHDFFEGEYSRESAAEHVRRGEKYSDNWSLDALTTPEREQFFQPDRAAAGREAHRLSPAGFGHAGLLRQPEFRRLLQGVFRADQRRDAVCHTYSAARADTYHQLTLPWTFFNWLNVDAARRRALHLLQRRTPAPAARTPMANRTVFNTGIGASFKASQLWAGATNSFLQMDGLRHIIEPSANYVYVPEPQHAAGATAAVRLRDAEPAAAAGEFSRLQQH